jgi:adenylate cyclase
MLEIEKKWLVDKYKCPIFLKSFNKKDLDILDTEQGYLEFAEDDNWIIRYRHINERGINVDKYFVDLKTKGLLVREEISHRINEEEYIRGISKCKGRTIRKTRYCHMDVVYYEIDVYKDHDFVTCEVEFKNMKEANEFVPPDWCYEDVTYDLKYKNMNLGK